MDEEKRNEESSAEDEKVDFELAKEAAGEVISEVIRRWGGGELEDGGFYLEEELTDEELEQRAEELLKELNVRANEIYRQKKQEKKSSD
jgi:hypothetical protein